MTLGMWLYAICVILVSIGAGLVIYSIQNKIPFRKAVFIKWEYMKLVISYTFKK